jgi:hypothetical protein
MTASDKLVTAQLQPGNKIVVRDAGSFLTVSDRKTGESQRVATVIGLEKHTQNRPGRRAQSIYTILTDIGSVEGNAPAQTHYNFESLSEKSQKNLLSQTEIPAEEEPANLTVVNGTDGLMHVHKIGCQDIARTRKNGQFDILAVNELEAVQEIWSDFVEEWDGDLSLGEDNTHFYPCISWPTFKMTLNVESVNAKLESIGRPDLKLNPDDFKPEAPLTDDKAYRNFADLAESAPTEAARAYWKLRANERVFLS